MPTPPPPATLADRLGDKYDLDLATRPREQTDANLATCETNQCEQFDSARKLCRRIATGCQALERWVTFLTNQRKWCEHWGPKPKEP